MATAQVVFGRVPRRSRVAVATLAAALSGGCSSTPIAAVLTGDAGGGADTAPSRASQVVTDGYLMAGPWAGSGFTATDPGAATITPACTASSCTPAFSGNEFCMQGKVTGRADYTGFAMLGWNVASRRAARRGDLGGPRQRRDHGHRAEHSEHGRAARAAAGHRSAQQRRSLVCAADQRQADRLERLPDQLLGRRRRR